MAGSATVGWLRVLLTMDTAQYDAASKRVASAAQAWSKDLKSIGQQATQVGQALTRTLTVPLVALGAGAIKSAMDFESSFAGVRKTVDATEVEFAQLAQGLRNMAKEIPVNVNELNRVAEAAGQLGIAKEDILQFTRTMADLGVTTNLTADEAATATAQIQNIFGAAGKETDRFGATLVALGNAGASTEKDIIEMSKRIAGAGHQVGLTQGQVLAFASSLASVGINAEAGGSAISRVFLKIGDAVAKGGADMDEFARVAGMSGAQFKQAFETDAAGATTAFIAGLGRLKGEGENVNATIEGLVGKNIILKDTLLRASGAGSLLTDNLKLQSTAWQANTALTTEAAERYKTFESQTRILWAQVRDLGITLGAALIPAMRDLISVLTPVIAGVGKAAEWFGKLPEPIRMSALGVTALVAAIGPALWVFGSVTTAVGTVIGAFAKKGIAMRAITAAYPLMTAAIGSTAAAMAGTGALFVALGAALYGVGKAVADLYAHWKAGGSMWAFFSARDDDNFVRRWLGLSSGIKAVAVEAQAAAPALAAVGTSAAAGGEQAAAGVGKARLSIAGLGEESSKAKAKVDTFAESLKALGGADAIAGAQEVRKQLEALGGPLNVPPGKLAEMAARLREGAEAALLMGNSGLAAQYELLARTLDPMAAFQQRYNVALGVYVTQAGMAAAATQAVNDQFHELADTVTRIQPILQNTFKPDFLVPFKAAVQQNTSAAGSSIKGFFGQVFGGAEGTSKSISTFFQQAFTGGGGAAGAVKAFATQTMSNMLGMIPGVGPWAQAFAGPIVEMLSKLTGKFKAFFSGIFGGPSAGELKGREKVAAFEDSLHDALTAQQELEAGGEEWKRTVIAIRDAYIAQGRTAAEAEADAKRLWESSKKGAEEAARVIEEIRRKMENLPTEHDFTVTTHFRDDGAPPGNRGDDGDDWRFGDDDRTPMARGGIVTSPTRALIGEAGPEAVLPLTLDRLRGFIPNVPSIPSLAPAFTGDASAAVAGASMTSNNYVMVAIPVEAAGDAYRITREVVRALPQSIRMNEADLRVGIERVIEDYKRTYSRG